MKKRRRRPNIALQIGACAGAAVLLLLAGMGTVRGFSRLAGRAVIPEADSVQNHAVMVDSARDEADVAGTAGGVDVAVSVGTAGEADAAASAGTAGEADAAGSADGAETAQTRVRTKKWSSPMERYVHDDDFWSGCPERDVQLLTPNEFSRPQIALEEVNDIVIHYVDEPGSTAQQNRDYFESLKTGEGRSVSSHFVISLDGTIVQCIPLGEVAYASNHRNRDTISIECCHPDDTGKFTEETYSACVNLTAWLCYSFELTPEHVIRHHDVTGKDCPIYYVRHPDAWEQLKADVAARFEEYETEYGKLV